MKRKLLVIWISMMIAVSLLVLSSCDFQFGNNQTEPPANEEAQAMYHAIYDLYVADALSKNQTPDDYETWLESIRGEDGRDGKDGITPRLRINEETGEWEVSTDEGATWQSLGFKARGEDGKDGEDGEDGKDGAPGKDGVDGEDGKDGITPQLRINDETNEWEVSVDNGLTWTSLGVKATGAPGKDGVDGEDGKDGVDGEDGKDGVDGAPGKDGIDGEDGKDGITPRLRINEVTGEWEVSMDNGATWESLGVVARGEDGKNGEDGEDLTACEHVFANWIVVYEPTCESLGINKRICTKCNEVEHDYTEKIGHKFYVIEVIEETCEEIRTIEACETCGLMKYAIVANSHSLSYYEGKPVTCTSDGWEAYVVCSKCNYNTFVLIPALGHNFVDGVCIRCENPQYRNAQYNAPIDSVPNSWNELTFETDDQSNLIVFLTSNFFEYDYKFENDVKFNADGTINKNGIVEDAYTTNYSAATKLEDVTALVDAKWGYTAEQREQGGYAWKITLREDLKWNDGTPITAADFVYSMKEQLNPLFKHYRADTYYDQTTAIKNAKAYFNAGSPIYVQVANMGFFSNAEAVAAGYDLYVKPRDLFGSLDNFVDAYGNPMPEWIKCDNTIYALQSSFDAGTEEEEGLSGAWIMDTYGEQYLDVGCGYESSCAVVIGIYDVKWEDVGIYSIDEENAIVICWETPHSLLMDDGSISYEAVSFIANLPLVKRDLYEACKIAPDAGSTLWTTRYNTSVETTASWGPYMLVEYVAGQYYRLEKNPYWYGYNMPEYLNQYQVTSINCVKSDDKMAGFMAGELDDYTLNKGDSEYATSEYAYYSVSGGAFGIQLFSDLETLKNSGNNNGILAIKEFRQAISFAIDREDLVKNLYEPNALPCLGLYSDAYYYDVYNSPYLADGGNYRNNSITKAGLLRVYGAIEAADGTWTVNGVSSLSLEDAYEMLTGYDLALAKKKINKAIEILISNPEYYGYDPHADITIIYGAASDTTTQRRCFEYMEGIIAELTSGTVLEGKINLVFTLFSDWSNTFRSGEIQIGFAWGWSGSLFDPYHFSMTFMNDIYSYHPYVNMSEIYLTITLPAGEYDHAGETFTMSAWDWYLCLNAENQYGAPYNFDDGHASVEARVTILATLEQMIIDDARSIQIMQDASASLLSAKFSYITDEYNIFVGFGGIRYLEVVYTDAEWEALVEAYNGDLSALYSPIK